MVICDPISFGILAGINAYQPMSHVVFQNEECFGNSMNRGERTCHAEKNEILRIRYIYYFSRFI